MKNDRNLLFALSDDEKENLFFKLREAVSPHVVEEHLRLLGLAETPREQIDAFFRHYAEQRWSNRIERAAQEANALVRLVQENSGQFSEAMLAVLGQEAFSQIAKGNVNPDVLAKYTALFLRAKEQDRAERALSLQQEKARLSYRTKTETALDAFAKDLPKNPQAHAAFQALRAQLLEQIDHLEAA